MTKKLHYVNCLLSYESTAKHVNHFSEPSSSGRCPLPPGPEWQLCSNGHQAILYRGTVCGGCLHRGIHNHLVLCTHHAEGMDMCLGILVGGIVRRGMGFLFVDCSQEFGGIQALHLRVQISSKPTYLLFSPYSSAAPATMSRAASNRPWNTHSQEEHIQNRTIK